MIPPGNEKCNAAQSMILMQHGALPLSFRLFPNRRPSPAKGRSGQSFKRLYQTFGRCATILHNSPWKLTFRIKASPGRGKLSPQVTDEGAGQKHFTQIPLIRRYAPPSPQGVKAFAPYQAAKIDFSNNSPVFSARKIAPALLQSNPNRTII